jgi:hypothetical protein
VAKARPEAGLRLSDSAKKGQIQIAVLALAAAVVKVGVRAGEAAPPTTPRSTPPAVARAWILVTMAVAVAPELTVELVAARRAELEGKTRSDFADIVQIGGKDPSDGQVAQALGGCEYRASMRSAACLRVPPSFFF